MCIISNFLLSILSVECTSRYQPSD
jgi:hypothetical protein